MLTKKDYIAIARIFSDSRHLWRTDGGYVPLAKLGAIERIEEDLASYCERDNPNFSRSRFLAACQDSSETRQDRTIGEGLLRACQAEHARQGRTK